MPADPELVELLHDSSERAIQAVERLSEEIRDDRRRTDTQFDNMDGRIGRIDDRLIDVAKQISSAVKQIADLSTKVVALAQHSDEQDKTIKQINDRCGTLVVEKKHKGEDGKEVVELTPAQAGLGRVGTFLAILAAMTPLTLGVLEVLSR